MSDDFKAWYDLEAPEEVPFPGAAAKDLGKMQIRVVTRILRPDRCYNAVKIFVAATMTEKYVQPPALDYARIYKQSSALTPMVFILSPGADPQADIQALGDEMGFQAPNKFRFIALILRKDPKVAKATIKLTLARPEGSIKRS